MSSFITVLVAALSFSGAAAQTLTAEEESLEFSVWLENGSATASRMIRLTLSNATDVLRFMPNDLTAQNGELLLQRDGISIPDAVQLQSGRPTDVLVTIGGISAPGDYRGRIQFATVAADVVPLDVPVHLVARARPSMEPLVQLFSFQVTKCLWSWTCSINDVLLPDALEGSQRSLVFVNRTIEAVVVNEATSGVLARGDKSGDIVDGADLMPTWPTRIEANRNVIVPLAVPRASTRADRYQGSLSMSLVGLAQPVAANFVLDVRDGIIPSLFVLLAAISVGRKVQPKKPPDSNNPRKASLTILETFFSKAAGTEVRKNDAHPILKALGFLLLLFLLALIGLKTLYVDVATFGANGIFDYLGLFLWGMSSDIAKKTLENVSS